MLFLNKFYRFCCCCCCCCCCYYHHYRNRRYYLSGLSSNVSTFTTWLWLIMVGCAFFLAMADAMAIVTNSSFDNANNNNSHLFTNSPKLDDQNDTGDNSSCSFETILAQYPEEKVCRYNIDLSGPPPVVGQEGSPWTKDGRFKYAHCHVIVGHVSLRSLMFTKFNKLEQLMVFENLEYIKDFLLIYNLQSAFTNVSLGQLFPRLKQIYGYTRIENFSLFISNYDCSDQVNLTTIQEICGPVKYFVSKPYFRHSPTYWRVVEKYGRKRYFSQKLKPFPPDLVQVEQWYDNTHDQHLGQSFEAKLRFNNLIQEHDLQRSKAIHVSIYEIDPIFYNFVETGLKTFPFGERLFCNESSRLVILSDLDYTDKQKFQHYSPDEFVQNRMLFINNTKDSGADSDDATHTAKLISSSSSSLPSLLLPPEHYHYHRRLDNFDICQIKNFRIDPTVESVAKNSKAGTELDLIMNHGFQFYLRHVYIIKVELCSIGRHDHCRIYDRYLFIPKLDQLKPMNVGDQDLLITMILIWMIIIFIMGIVVSITCLCRKRLRFKSFVNMEEISVNPDYGLINQTMMDRHSLWSWPSMSTNSYNTCNFNNRMFSMNFDTNNNHNNNNNNVSCEIDRQNLIVFHQKQLGKGEFGFVYEGLLLDGQTQIRVAIKQLKDAGTNSINKEKFINEAKFMKTFQSNFLVKLIGISTVVEPILVVMEYMESGDLKRFLRQRYQDYLKSRNQSLLPTMDDFVLMAIQIADGMFYLHTKKVIHRDLAARNCMVSSDLVVKIGDFGLTRDLYEKDYYRLSEEMPMPLRWMAPESVRKMIFTQQTDVWSYGVVLWEIMAMGEQPYRGKLDLEVKKMISNNKTLPKPFYFFEPLWNISKQCWKKRPNQRPSFDEIIESLYKHLVKDRQKFDQLSYFQSSRMGSYVRFSPFGLFLNHCYELISKYKHDDRKPLQLHQLSQKQNSNISNDSGINSTVRSSSSSSSSSASSWSTCSTTSTAMSTITRPLLNGRNANDSNHQHHHHHLHQYQRNSLPPLPSTPPSPTSQTSPLLFPGLQQPTKDIDQTKFRNFDRIQQQPRQSMMMMRMNPISPIGLTSSSMNQSINLTNNRPIEPNSNNFVRQSSQQSSVSNNSSDSDNTCTTTTTNDQSFMNLLINGQAVGIRNGVKDGLGTSANLHDAAEDEEENNYETMSATVSDPLCLSSPSSSSRVNDEDDVSSITNESRVPLI